MEPSDAELLAQWRRGDKLAGTALFRRYFRQIRRFFFNKVAESDIEDLLQRTFAGVVEGRERFRDEASFRTYLFAIARRQLYRYLENRCKYDARFDDEQSASSIAAMAITPGTVLDAHAEQRHIQRALQRIPIAFQEVLELHYWEDLAAPEIAEILDIAPTTARTRLHRARKYLEDALAELMPREACASLDVEAVARTLGDKI